jgi:RNA polymerase sigma-70 factor (ECF subfamily)
MGDQDWLATRFEEQRARLRRVAYRMLGSPAEADDAVQDAWLRASHAGADEVDNLGGWLTTIVARVCLDRLRARRARREDPLDVHVPDPVVGLESDPEQAALLGDAVGLALLVVLETLSPAERVAFVLHDMFAIPFDEIARLLDTSPAAARQLASRGRRRVRGAAKPDGAVAAQREVVDAFFAAARGGDFDALIAVLDPDVVVRVDGGAARPSLTTAVEGEAAVAGLALRFALPSARLLPVIVNGGAGVVVVVDGRPFSLMAFTVAGGRIAEIDAISDPERLGAIVRDLLPPPR